MVFHQNIIRKCVSEIFKLSRNTTYKSICLSNASNCFMQQDIVMLLTK